MKMSVGDGDDKRSVPEGEPPSRRRDERRVAVVDNRIDSRELFVATREITIGHGHDTYRLRLTAQNKLILTK